jgi:hypothetical protein
MPSGRAHVKVEVADDPIRGSMVQQQPGGAANQRHGPTWPHPYVFYRLRFFAIRGSVQLERAPPPAARRE